MGNGVDMPPSSGTFYDLNSHADLAFYFKNDTDVAVAQWTDQSGNNNHATQATEANQASVSGGGLVFDGENDYYNLTSGISIGNETPYTLFAVINTTSFSSANTIISNVEGEEEYIVVKSNSQILIQQSGDITSLNDTSRPWPNNETMVLCITKDASRNYVVYKNGTAISFTSSTNNPGSTGDFDANAIGIIGGGASAFKGTIYELGLHERLLSDAEISSISSYLVNKLL